MSAMTLASLICNHIHDVIQSSGLYFVINQTPFSSYITIRKKIIGQISVNLSEVDKLEVEVDIAELKELQNKYSDLLCAHNELSKQYESIKVAFENEIEDHKATLTDIKEVSTKVSTKDKEIYMKKLKN